MTVATPTVTNGNRDDEDSLRKFVCCVRNVRLTIEPNVRRNMSDWRKRRGREVGERRQEFDD